MGNINIALNKATASNGYILPYSPSRAVDGSIVPTSRWLCSRLPAWISVDLGISVWVDKWIVRNMTSAGWPSPNYNISDFKLQGSSDNTSWFDIDIVTGNTANIVERTVSPTLARYFRIYVTKGLRINPQIASILELELYESDSTSPLLSNLVLSSGTIVPEFTSGNNSYTASAGYDTQSITVTPTAVDPKATIVINGADVVPSGTASPGLPLNVGSNNITIQVTSSLGNVQKLYTINATRNSSAYLTNLKTDSEGVEPEFTKSNFQYTLAIGYDISSVRFIPEAEDASAAIKVNGTAVSSGDPSDPIAVGAGQTINVAVEVTSAIGGTRNTYNVSVTRAGSPYLSSLAIAPAALVRLSPPFASTIYSYTSSTTGANITITPAAQDSNATIYFNGSVIASGTGKQLALNTGLNAVNITVTSAKGNDSRQYEIKITKV